MRQREGSGIAQAMTERARMVEIKKTNTAIPWLWESSIVSRCFCCFVSGLTLSVCFADSSPKGRAKGVGRLLIHLFFMVLQGIQLIIPAMLRQKLLMGALFQNFAVRQHDDVVRVLDGGQAVRHDQHGADGAHFF